MENLIAHVDTHRVLEEKVLSIPEPEFTDTWHPVSHGRLIAALEIGVNANGLRVISREYSLNKAGTRMFGVWGLDDAVTNGMKLAMGFRNSLNKTMAIGICAGVKVFVCDNLALSGDYIRFRKHTSGLNDTELAHLSAGAVESVIEKMEGYRNWINELKDRPIDLIGTDAVLTDTFKVTAYNLVFEDQVFTASKIPAFIEAFFAESVVAIDQSYPINSWYTLFNAVTRMLRGESIFHVSKATTAMERAVKGRVH